MNDKTHTSFDVTSYNPSDLPDMTGTNIHPNPVRTWKHRLINQWDVYRGCTGSAIASTTASHSGCVIVSALSGFGAGGASSFTIPFVGDTPMKIVFNFAMAPVMAAALTPVFENICGNDFSMNPRKDSFITKKIVQRFANKDCSFNPLHQNFLLNISREDYSVKKGLTAIFISLALASTAHVSAPHLSHLTKNQYGYDWEDRSRAIIAYAFNLTPEEKMEAQRLAEKNNGLTNAILFLRPDICKTR